MCVTAPARVLAVDGDFAAVDLDGVSRHASLVLLPEVKVGDWVLVGAGLVLETLTEAEVLELNDMLGEPAGSRKE
jgi:hydrogenase expression/formation protein HypC